MGFHTELMGAGIPVVALLLRWCMCVLSCFLVVVVVLVVSVLLLLRCLMFFQDPGVVQMREKTPPSSLQCKRKVDPFFFCLIAA